MWGRISGRSRADRDSEGGRRRPLPLFRRARRRRRPRSRRRLGFLGHVVFEKTTGPSTFDLVTIAVWESPEALAGAGDKVRAYYQSIGFDPPAMLARWGVTAALGN